MLGEFLFLVLTLTILFTIKPTNLKKSYSQISEIHDQNSINLTNPFDFTGSFSNYVGFDIIKWSCVFTRYAIQIFMIKPESISMS